MVCGEEAMPLLSDEVAPMPENLLTEDRMAANKIGSNSARKREEKGER